MRVVGWNAFLAVAGLALLSSGRTCCGRSIPRLHRCSTRGDRRLLTGVRSSRSGPSGYRLRMRRSWSTRPSPWRSSGNARTATARRRSSWPPTICGRGSRCSTGCAPPLDPTRNVGHDFGGGPHDTAVPILAFSKHRFRHRPRIPQRLRRHGARASLRRLFGRWPLPAVERRGSRRLAGNGRAAQGCTGRAKPASTRPSHSQSGVASLSLQDPASVIDSPGARTDVQPRKAQLHALQVPRLVGDGTLRHYCGDRIPSLRILPEGGRYAVE